MRGFSSRQKAQGTLTLTFEECYELMLAYAAQGLPRDAGSQSGEQVRVFLQRAVTTLTGLAEGCATAVQHADLEPAERYQAFLAVLDRDAGDALAALELVLVQSAISSQLIDNLNASSHLRCSRICFSSATS